MKSVGITVNTEIFIGKMLDNSTLLHVFAEGGHSEIIMQQCDLLRYVFTNFVLTKLETLRFYMFYCFISSLISTGLYIYLSFWLSLSYNYSVPHVQAGRLTHRIYIHRTYLYIRNPRNKIPGTTHHRNHIPGTTSQEPHPRNHFPGTTSQEPHPRNHIPGNTSQEPHPRNHITGTISQEPHSRNHITGTTSQERDHRNIFEERDTSVQTSSILQTTSS